MARLKPSKVLPALDSGPIPLIGIREQGRKQLIDLINTKRGKKWLILDPSLNGPLSLLDANLHQAFAEHGVDKILYLDGQPLPPGPALGPSASTARVSEHQVLLYVVRATIENSQMIARQIKASSSSASLEVAIFWVPRITPTVAKVIEEEGLQGNVVASEYPLHMIALEDDVLSTEAPDAFRQCVVDGDSTSLFYMARAIMQLQTMFGVIPRLQGQGPAAVAVRELLSRMRREGGLPASAIMSPSRISRAILLDRESDLVTPMMTQLTFEGLIDEVTGISHGVVPWVSKERKSESGKVLLNSADPAFRELRDLPYKVAVERLKSYAHAQKRDYGELNQKDMGKMKSFVSGLSMYNSLERLVDIVQPVHEQIKTKLFYDKWNREQAIVENDDLEGGIAFMEEMMYRGSPLVDVLRMLLLLSAANQGLSRKHLDALRSEILHTYGHEHLLTLNSLEKAGLVRLSTGSKANWTTIRKGLRLIPPTPSAPSSSSDPPGGAGGAGPSSSSEGPAPDLSHIYNGYAPLSIRLVEAALSSGSGWSTMPEVFAALPGGSFDVVQSVDAEGTFVEKTYRSGESVGERAPGPEVILVVFIGGVTAAEVSSLRWLASQSNNSYRFLILTTSMVNGRTLLEPFQDPVISRLATLARS